MSSEIKVTNIKHSSSGSNNLVLASDGDISVTNNLNVGTIKDATGGATAITTDSSGHVLTPNRPSFCVALANATQGVNANTENLIQWATELHDNGDNFNHTSSTVNGINPYGFKAPVTGVYFFSVLVYVYHTNATMVIIKINDNNRIAVYSSDHTNNVNPSFTSGSIVYELTAGDIITTYVYPSDASDVYWGASADGGYMRSSHFSGFLIG